MSPKRPSLRSAVHDAAHAQDEAPEAPAPRRRVSSRQGTKGVLIHLDPKMARRLKVLAAEEDTTIQALGVEAFTALLESR